MAHAPHCVPFAAMEWRGAALSGALVPSLLITEAYPAGSPSRPAQQARSPARQVCAWAGGRAAGRLPRWDRRRVAVGAYPTSTPAGQARLIHTVTVGKTTTGAKKRMEW